jgi:hypothetical protein
MLLGHRTLLVSSVAALLLAPPLVRAQLQAALRLEKNGVTVRGRWNPADAKAGEVRPHLPLVEIRCHKVDGFCMQASAGVHGDEPTLAVVYYQIVQWDKKGIVAANEDFSCTTNQITINFHDSSVIAMDLPRKKGKSVLEGCKALPHIISYNLIGERSEVSERQMEAPPAQ